MNIAIIFAGGTGKRMRSTTVPKQFLQLYGKPIIAYTLEIFQEHSDIDGIIVVSLESWIPEMEKIVKKYKLTKVSKIVPGGATGQESIFHGLSAARELYPEDSIVLIHDGVRPLVSSETLTADIECAKEKGNAVTVTPAIETIFVDNVDANGELSSDTGHVGTILDRKTCHMAKAPQCFHLGDLLACHARANAEGRDDFIDSASMAMAYGIELYTVDGNTENIKITTPIDFYMFKAIVDANENSQIFG